MSFSIQNILRPSRKFECLEARRLLTSVDPIVAYQSFVNAAYEDAPGRTPDAAGDK